MENAKRCMKATMLGAAALYLPALAWGSGHLPLPPETETFISPEACIAALEKVYALDRKRTEAQTVTSNGDTREVNLDTKGIVKVGGNRTRYEATIWFSNGIYRSDLSQTETSHSYQHFIRECDGATMRTIGDQGYTLSTFDPAEPTENSKQ